MMSMGQLLAAVRNLRIKVGMHLKELERYEQDADDLRYLEKAIEVIQMIDVELERMED